MNSKEQEQDNRRIYLKVQREIRQVEDQLVTAIQDALNNSDYPKSKSDKEQLEESQFRNLLQVAATAEKPQVVENFLLYQVGREKKWGRGKGSLAQVIIRDINNLLKKLAQDIANQSNHPDYVMIWIQLIRLYLGYGARYLTYLKKGKIDDKF